MKSHPKRVRLPGVSPEIIAVCESFEMDSGVIALKYLEAGCPFGPSLRGMMGWAIEWIEAQTGVRPVCVLGDLDDSEEAYSAVNLDVVQRVQATVGAALPGKLGTGSRPFIITG